MGRYRACLKSLKKIGHNKAFLLVLLHCFKIRNLSFTLTCITGKYFTKPWPDWGWFQLIWGHSGLLRVIWTHLDWFKLSWGQWGSLGLPWLLVSPLKILFHLNLFLLFEQHLGDAYVGKRDSLWYIYILQEEKGEENRSWGVILHLLSPGMKTSVNLKFRNYESDENETYMTYARP